MKREAAFDEDYSDAELPTLIALLDENGAAYIACTLRRLLCERDEAREAALVLADALDRRDWTDHQQDMFDRARGYSQ